jgi:hypothetical protein
MISLATNGDIRMLAYIDPGSGSFILQALVATLAGTAVAVNVYWKKIKGFFGLSAGGDDERDESGNPPPSDE